VPTVEDPRPKFGSSLEITMDRGVKPLLQFRKPSSHACQFI
jgi:hypothetical protein